MIDELSEEQLEKMAEALGSGRRIEAIKIYREATGKGLKEAKDYIDSLVNQLAEKDPEILASLKPKGAGCTAVMLAGLGIYCALRWLV
jgi:ribosomal protein L7/L12